MEPTLIKSFRKSCITGFKSQSAIFGFNDVLGNNYLSVNHLLSNIKMQRL